MMPMWNPMGGLAGLVVLVLVVAVVLALIGYTNRPPGNGTSAEEQLRMRYARGELSTEEFQQRLATLRSAAGYRE
jgi:uncharacterized membrane protein